MSSSGSQATGWSREQMAARAAQDIPDGSYVNLGIGIPELVAQFVPEGRTFIYHTENGLLGMGPPPPPGEEDFELINAGYPDDEIHAVFQRIFGEHYDAATTQYNIDYARRRVYRPFMLENIYPVQCTPAIRGWSTIGSPSPPVRSDRDNFL